jgi:hypothetical protein
MLPKGIVYILTNPCLDGWIKIGKSDKDDIQDRLTELNSPSNIPLSFRAYAIYRVENSLSVEQGIQKIIDTININLRAIEVLDNGFARKREFYKMPPEQAYEVFKQVAKMRGDEKFLELVKPTADDLNLEAAANVGRKTKINLKDIGIPEGASLTFVNDESVTCIAKPDVNKLLYEGKEFSISALALKLLQEKCGWNVKAIAGGAYFKYNGLKLTDLRDQKEKL